MEIYRYAHGPACNTHIAYTHMAALFLTHTTWVYEVKVTVHAAQVFISVPKDSTHKEIVLRLHVLNCISI